MACRLLSHRRTRFTAGALARGLMATILVASVGWSGALLAANQSVQGAKKTEDASADAEGKAE